jgi:hypothetical protein
MTLVNQGHMEDNSVTIWSETSDIYCHIDLSNNVKHISLKVCIAECNVVTLSENPQDITMCWVLVAAISLVSQGRHVSNLRFVLFASFL